MTPANLHQMRTLVQTVGWGEFMLQVGHLMAEQSDKTAGRQSKALYECSHTVHALRPFFEECGHFTYPPELAAVDPLRVFVEKVSREKGEYGRYGYGQPTALALEAKALLSAYGPG